MRGLQTYLSWWGLVTIIGIPLVLIGMFLWWLFVMGERKP
jgi:hypothetical protein